MKFVTLLLTSVLFFSTAFSAPQKKGPVVLNPTSLRSLLMERNIDIAMAMNQVQQAKAQVSIARGNLLPSLNLGAVISSGPSFMLTSVSFLLPFLMPSKWLDVTENTYLLKAQGTSYYVAQLNAFSSAYAVYATVLGDIQLRTVLYQQYENLKAMEDYLRVPAEMGMIPMEDYLRAQAQAQLALVQVSQIDDLILQEKASVRNMLGLELDQEIIFESATIAASPVEGLDPKELFDKVFAKSPEVLQMDQLITSAEYNRWSKAFSFLTGSSLGTSTPASGGSFGSLIGSETVNMGFGYFPSLELGDLKIEQMRLRKKELRLDHAQLIETTLGSFAEAQKQYAAASIAEENMRKVYDNEYARYKMGMSNILNVLTAANGMTTSVVNKVKAATEINTLRISLHRIMISDEFSQIQKCEIQRRSSGGLIGKLGKIFNPGKNRFTLDEICKK